MMSFPSLSAIFSKSKNVNFLITNSVPLNGGDEALLRATIALIQHRFPDAGIIVLCKDLILCRKYLPDINFDSDLEYVNYPADVLGRIGFKIRTVLEKLISLSPSSVASLQLATGDERRILNIYKKSDLIISSPGGFLHDFYGIENRLKGFEIAMNFGIPVILFSQSIGPFWKIESKKRIHQVLNRIDAIVLRERRSLMHLADCGVDASRTVVGGDMAFYLHRVAPNLYVEKNGPVKKIAMSFRSWPIEAKDGNELIEKAAVLCRHLLESDPQREIMFLSTCQGVDGYVDDSIIADVILKKLPSMMRERCEIRTQRQSTHDLVKSYSEADCYIGMRLHGAILSMLGGTPSMAIAYEEKTVGIFSELGLESFQIDYREKSENWISCAQNFIFRIEEIRGRLSSILDKAAEVAESGQNLLSDMMLKRDRK
jgi:colanic acid/amylovoran biosynthesis protein